MSEEINSASSASSADRGRDGVTNSSKRCGECGRVFSRTEHLLRHQRTHTQEKPFTCPFCHQRFQRSDVQRRHINEYCPERFETTSSPNPTAQKRVRFACRSCNEKKLRCDRSRPCSSCQRKGIPCTETSRIASESRSSVSDMLGDMFQDNGLQAISTDHAMSNVTNEDYSIQVDIPINAALTGDSALQQHSSISSPTLPLDNLIMSSIEGTATAGEQRVLRSSMIFQPLQQTVVSLPASSEDIYLSLIDNTTSSMPMQISQPGSLQQDAFSFFGDDYLSHQYQDDIDFSGLFLFGDTFNIPESIITFDEPPINHAQNVHIDLGGPDGMSNLVLSNSPSTVVMMQEQYQYHSRAPSPAPHQQQQHPHWLRDLSSQPIRAHNRVIMKIFIKISIKFVATTFKTFQGFSITPETLPEVILAMAAVGGVFCDVIGSFEVARSFYNDARRMLFTKIYSEFEATDSQKVDIIRTYILLEIFGLSSGDKRHFEFSEAWHMQMLQTVYQYGFLSPSIPFVDVQTRQKLLDALYLLECYRVVIMHRPPNLYPFLNSEQNVARDDISVVIGDTDDTPNGQIFAALQSYLTPEATFKPTLASAQNLSTFSALVVLSWQAMPFVHTGIARPLWKRETFLLAFNRWIKLHDPAIEASTMMLFHLHLMNLYTDMTHLHQLAQLFLRQSKTEDHRHIFRIKNVREWCMSEDYKVALWHANQVGEIAQATLLKDNAANFSSNHSFDSPTGSSDDDVSLETPHTAVCVYFAYLMLWASVITTEDADLVLAKSHLHAGIAILQDLKVRIAKVFKDTMKRLIDSLEVVS